MKKKERLASLFSDFVYKIRKERNMTQVEVMKVSGLSRANISNIENKGSNVTIDTMEKTLVGLGLNLSDFASYIKEIEG